MEKKSTRRPRRWQFQEAKARLAHVVDETVEKGPQIITRHGKDVAAVIPIADLPKVLAATQPEENRPGAILECFQRAPAALAQLDLTRDPTPIPASSMFKES